MEKNNQHNNGLSSCSAAGAPIGGGGTILSDYNSLKEYSLHMTLPGLTPRHCDDPERDRLGPLDADIS